MTVTKLNFILIYGDPQPLHLLPHKNK